MKYTILINQAAWKLYYPSAKINDAIVFDSIKSLCTSASKKIIRTGDGYTFISSRLILEENPMLHLTSKGSITTIIKRLQVFGLIEYKNIDRKNYYKLTEDSEKLEKVDSSKFDQVFRKMNTKEEKSTKGVQKNEQEVFRKMNGSINNKNISINNKRLKDIPAQSAGDIAEIPELPNPPKKAEKKVSDPRVKEIHDFYLANHPLAENYFPQYPKERKIIKNLITNIDANGKSVNLITERLQNYFKSDFYQATGWALESFVKNFNAFTKVQKQNRAFKSNYERWEDGEL